MIKLWVQAKQVLDALSAKPDLFWAVLSLLPTVRVAGPWTRLSIPNPNNPDTLDSILVRRTPVPDAYAVTISRPRFPAPGNTTTHLIELTGEKPEPVAATTDAVAQEFADKALMDRGWSLVSGDEA